MSIDDPLDVPGRLGEAIAALTLARIESPAPDCDAYIAKALRELNALAVERPAAGDDASTLARVVRAVGYTIGIPMPELDETHIAALLAEVVKLQGLRVAAERTQDAPRSAEPPSRTWALVETLRAALLEIENESSDRIAYRVAHRALALRPEDAPSRRDEFEIIERYTPPHAKRGDPDYPILAVRHMSSDRFLRHSKGPRQGHFLDIYGDDYQRRDLAEHAIAMFLGECGQREPGRGLPDFVPPQDAPRSAERPHNLTWSGTEWVAPCGCRYHPDDDNGSHGGAPHVHPCEKHAAAEWPVDDARAVLAESRGIAEEMLRDNEDPEGAESLGNHIRRIDMLLAAAEQHDEGTMLGATSPGGYRFYDWMEGRDQARAEAETHRTRLAAAERAVGDDSKPPMGWRTWDAGPIQDESQRYSVWTPPEYPPRFFGATPEEASKKAHAWLRSQCTNYPINGPACPSCGWANNTIRKRCRNCGADLVMHPDANIDHEVRMDAEDARRVDAHIGAHSSDQPDTATKEIP